MNALFRWFFAAAWLALAAAPAQAAVTCTSITSPGYSTNYVINTTTSLQTSFTITCTRDTSSEAANGLAYSVTANNGLQPVGGSANNRARLTQGGTNYDLRYDLFTTGCAGAQWKTGTNITGTVSWPAGVAGQASDTKTFWGCINTAQAPTAAGAYTDTVKMTATYNPGTGNTTLQGDVQVSIHAPANCAINSGPGNFALTYNAFQGSPLVSANAFTHTCTVSMPYELSVSPSAGTLAGVNYTVDITDTGVAGNVVTSTSGTGIARTLFVRVTAPAEQAGTCAGAACVASQSHTLTLTY